MLKAASFLGAAFFFLAAPVLSQSDSICKDSVCFSSFEKIGRHEIPVKGLAQFDYLFLNVYTAALYAPTGVNSSQDVLEDKPKSLILHYHRDIKKKWMLQAAENRLKKNPVIDIKALEPRLQLINAAFRDIKKNDRYELRYEPKIGTTLLLNGKKQTTIPGEDFQRAYFGIWLSEFPLNKKFRDQLLSGKGVRDA